VGGKRSRTRQYVHLFLAGLILFGGLACVRLRGPLHVERWDHLEPVQARIEGKDFEGAVQVYQDMLAGPNADQCADLALFDLGLLYAHYGNPKKDYKKSLQSFTRLTRDHPASPLVDEARIWIDVLESMEKAQRVDVELDLKKKETR